MVIKVYISGISGNKEVKKRQQRVMMILESKNISYEVTDITEPGKESDKEFMQQNGKPRGEQKYPLPPQIFNDEEYCGPSPAKEIDPEESSLESSGGDSEDEKEKERGYLSQKSKRLLYEVGFSEFNPKLHQRDDDRQSPRSSPELDADEKTDEPEATPQESEENRNGNEKTEEEMEWNAEETSKGDESENKPDKSEEEADSEEPNADE